jgi:hypothetical protein
MTTKFATGEILRKPVEVVKGRILNGTLGGRQGAGKKIEDIDRSKFMTTRLQPVKS